MNEDQITTTQLVSDLALKVYESIDDGDLGSKDSIEKINIVLKSVKYISEEEEKAIETEESENNRELEREKIQSNERIRMAEIESNRKNRILGYIENAIKGAGIGVDILKLILTLSDNKEQRKFDRNLTMMNLAFKRQSDKETRNFIDEQNLKSYIFEETGTARSTASRRNESMIKSFSEELNRYRKY